MGAASKLLLLFSSSLPRRSPAALCLPLSRPLSTASAARHPLFPRPRPRRLILSARAQQLHSQALPRDPFPDSSLPWPQDFSRIVNHLISIGYSDRRVSVPPGDDDDDSFVGFGELSGEFVKAAQVCLSFARDRPDLLRSVSSKDVEVVVRNGSPFLFKNGENSVRRMNAFLSGNARDVMQSERAQTVDLMRYLLSYVQGPSRTNDNQQIQELIEASVQNLLGELANVHGTSQKSNVSEPLMRMTPLAHEQFSRPQIQNIEMKRGDWICPKCRFMNFARNMKCLECDEARPKRQLTGGEWECPQCDYFNYGRNMSCLRCDCRRPGNSPQSAAAASGAGFGYSSKSSIQNILNGSDTDKSEVERRLAANDEKAERWFSKMSQLDDTTDISSVIADDDFPEIMPLRKGTNRFVVSTRKTPLQRRLENAQYRGNLEDGSLNRNNSQPGGFGRLGSDKTTESSISESLDRILGRSSSASGSSSQSSNGEMNSGARGRVTSSDYRQSLGQGKDPNYVPFVPLPPDMFRKSPKSEDGASQSSEKVDSASTKADQPSGTTNEMFGRGGSGNALLSSNLEDLIKTKKDKVSSDASERWHEKVAELDGGTDLTNAISDEDFPDIMPLRKGENRFVVSKKKDRSLTSPPYKRRPAMEQANSSNFVPFVPFPPGYFAKKDKQPGDTVTTDTATETSSPAEKASVTTEKLEDCKAGDVHSVASGSVTQRDQNQFSSGESFKREFSEVILNETNVDNSYKGATGQSFGPLNNHLGTNNQSWNNKTPQNSNMFGSSSQNADDSQNMRESRNRGFSGKSLEGSAVKEADPLDMSEEAKAERWFRRAAQIKDISELSQIPDEDFPEIMPMRKGVNRFVVSKRKTPLERRLTSAQYRRNLPIVSTEPKNDTS